MEIVLKDLHTTIVGRSILHYPSLPSTMDFAKKLAAEGMGEGAVILCDEQTEGRGRQGRKWFDSPSGSILMSVIFRPAVEQLPQLNMLASLAIVLAIHKVAGIKSNVKWPNDVLIKGKKVAGILVENVFAGNALQASIVGVGLNVSLDVTTHPDIASIATSLSAEVGRHLGRDDVLKPLLEEMDALYQAVRRGEDVYRRWLPHVETLGKSVRIKSGKSVEEGLAQSINPDGSITLRRSDGSLVTIATGE
jgi:BirA family transcriptional regulator, biotin operon repressor / biotin---[acetyl-CoA-carboxylase] ligase